MEGRRPHPVLARQVRQVLTWTRCEVLHSLRCRKLREELTGNVLPRHNEVVGERPQQIVRCCPSEWPLQLLRWQEEGYQLGRALNVVLRLQQIAAQPRENRSSDAYPLCLVEEADVEDAVKCTGNIKKNNIATTKTEPPSAKT